MKQILFLALFILHTDKIYGKIIPQTFRKKCRDASEIYTGRVIKTKVIKVNKTFFGSFETYEVTIVTDKIWKGFAKDTMICLATEGICSPNVFHPENNYLVYSKNNQITGTYGGGFNLSISYFRKEIFKLNIRYLFRKPNKVVGGTVMIRSGFEWAYTSTNSMFLAQNRFHPIIPNWNHEKVELTAC